MQPHSSQPEPVLELTDEQKAAWLNAVRGNHSAGNRSVLKHIGVTVPKTYVANGGHERTTQAPPSKAEIDAYLAANPDFRDDYLEARGYSDDQIRAELVRRAIDGIDEPIYHQGVMVGEVRRYSDRLLEFLARTRLPEALALQAHRQQIEVSGPEGGPIEVQQGVSLADVAAVLRRAGAIPGLGSGDALPALPAASEVLAQPE
jgi:hypothetical protein